MSFWTKVIFEGKFLLITFSTLYSLKQDSDLKISGSDKQLVGMTAAKIKTFRPPEPYKGKGIKEVGQYVRRKEGKKK